MRTPIRFGPAILPGCCCISILQACFHNKNFKGSIMKQRIEHLSPILCRYPNRRPLNVTSFLKKICDRHCCRSFYSSMLKRKMSSKYVHHCWCLNDRKKYFLNCYRGLMNPGHFFHSYPLFHSYCHNPGYLASLVDCRNPGCHNLDCLPDYHIHRCYNSGHNPG